MSTNQSPFHPQSIIRQWGDGVALRLFELLCGCITFGSTGSGKSSAILRHIALGLLAAGYGGVVLCSKPEERKLWEKLARECGREDDLIIVDESAKWRFNPLDWETNNPQSSSISIVQMLYFFAQVTSANGGQSKKGDGDGEFFESALQYMLSMLIGLVRLAGLQITFSLLSSIVTTSPLSLEQLADPKFRESSICVQVIEEADKRTTKGCPEARADFDVFFNYFCCEFPTLSPKTRGIIVLMFSMLVAPLNTRPLRPVFSKDSNLTPEDAFRGKIIIVDLPVQTYGVAGLLANQIFKKCFQMAVIRRQAPSDGHLQPAFLAADEYQNFAARGDSEYQAVARSGGGISLFLTQSREGLIRALGSEEAADSLLANLMVKIFCHNTGGTNRWASELFGERYIKISSTNVGQNGGEEPHRSTGITRAEQKRYFVEPAKFTTLKRGGAQNNFQVEAIVYKAGELFPPDSQTAEKLPFKLLTFNQK